MNRQHTDDQHYDMTILGGLGEMGHIAELGAPNDGHQVNSSSYFCRA